MPAVLYFKVVDSDDWVDVDAYREGLGDFEEVRWQQQIRLWICSMTNYVYEKIEARLSSSAHHVLHPAVSRRIGSWAGSDMKHNIKGMFLF